MTGQEPRDRAAGGFKQRYPNVHVQALEEELERSARLRSERDALSAECDRLREENASQAKSLETATLELVQERYDSLQTMRQNEELLYKTASAAAEYMSLETRNRELAGEVARLRRENADLSRVGMEIATDGARPETPPGFRESPGDLNPTAGGSGEPETPPAPDAEECCCSRLPFPEGMDAACNVHGQPSAAYVLGYARAEADAKSIAEHDGAARDTAILVEALAMKYGPLDVDPTTWQEAERRVHDDQCAALMDVRDGFDGLVLTTDPPTPAPAPKPGDPQVNATSWGKVGDVVEWRDKHGGVFRGAVDAANDRELHIVVVRRPAEADRKPE